MPNEYKLQRIRGTVGNDVYGEAWDVAEPLSINIYPWDKNGYTPMTTAKLIYTDDCLCVRFESYETSIRAVNILPNSQVCQDSCVELFINPHSEKLKEYINFEINPIGTAHIGIGRGRHDRRLIGGDIYRMIQIQSSVSKEQLECFNGPLWRIDLYIFFNFFRKLFGVVDFLPGHKMGGNLYKCGDLAEYPHYGCWSPITCEHPDFHRPEFFGSLVL